MAVLGKIEILKNIKLSISQKQFSWTNSTKKNAKCCCYRIFLHKKNRTEEIVKKRSCKYQCHKARTYVYKLQNIYHISSWAK